MDLPDLVKAHPDEKNHCFPIDFGAHPAIHDFHGASYLDDVKISYRRILTSSTAGFGRRCSDAVGFVGLQLLMWVKEWEPKAKAMLDRLGTLSFETNPSPMRERKKPLPVVAARF